VTRRPPATREGAVVPKKALGQHFLADPNILGVIGRLAELDPEDVVLEVGPGLGVLTRYLADRVAHVHAIELDRSLEPHLREELRSAGNVALVFGDALDVDPNALDPVPGKLVSNLPYAVATPIVVETLLRAPALQHWCVMVQREVADRFFAAPGSKAYGAVSVVVQLTSRRTGFHPVSRTVFRPPPNVDSALVAFRRIAPPGDLQDVRRVVDAAFGHRRKTLANALALASVASRERAVEALATLGARPDARAESLEPTAFVELARALRDSGPG
jgi:16S rRNA (adenine1518-N6/adenine1519-N6)-dimethyltransferase